MAEARNLVYALLKADDWTKLRGFAIEPPYIMPDFPDFYIADVLWDNRGGGAYIGHYAVERTTGDVWEYGACARYTSPPLTKLQETLRNRIGPTNAGNQEVRKPAAFCKAGEEPSVLKMGRPMWGLPNSSERRDPGGVEPANNGAGRP